MRTIDGYNFKNKRALVRVDFNVPLDNAQHITDTTRIDAALPTINKILGDGGSVILMSHLGRPRKGAEPKLSLSHLVAYIAGKLGLPVKFANDCIGRQAVEMSASLNPGEVLLLENLRFYKEEEEGDEDFAASLAALGDVYVNDAFGTAHRAHASTTVLATFFPNDKIFGYLMANEVGSLNKVLQEPKRPFTVVLGGAKVSSKIQIINHLIDKVDNLIIGGGMMFTFVKANGGNIGTSLVEEEFVELAKNIIIGSKSFNVNLLIPTDAIAANAFSNDAERQVVLSDMIPDGWMGLDIGPASIAECAAVLMNSKTILWNGPMGVFEMPNFAHGTEAVAKIIAKATEAGAFSLVGGGDSVAALNKFDLASKMSYVSTGGGAMLEYIEGQKLPGVAIIEE